MVEAVILAVAASMGFLRNGSGRMSLVFAGLVGVWRMGRVCPVVLRGLVRMGMRVHSIKDGVVFRTLHPEWAKHRIHFFSL